MMLGQRSRVRRIGTLLGLAVSLFAFAATAAAGNTITSHNWSGYAVHRSGVEFTTVVASWRQPAGTCTPGNRTYSAFWVGIGGYSLTARAMEQIGTELDCGDDGTESIYAWYELVPSTSRTIRMTVDGGDLLTAGVAVAGKHVTLTLADATRHEAFAKTVTVKIVDTSSAEWIAEAPSDCSSARRCTALTLADFSKVAFSDASATTSEGETGAIASSLWDTTRIVLGKAARAGAPIAGTGHATPSALTSAGSAFTVS